MSPTCPVCSSRLGRSLAVKFTSMTRLEKYWCDECRDLRTATIPRDFDLEDAGGAATAPLLWDLGALPEPHPFAVAA
jgi:hypothetical protein